MNDFVTWLRAQLDEDERVATGAGAASWAWTHGYGEMCNDPECPLGQLVAETKPGPTVLMSVHGYDIRDDWQGAAHIARHDPARALAEVEAKRRILDELDSWRHEWSDDAYLACSQATAEAGYGYGALPESRQGDPCTCGLDDRRDAIRRLLALPYADQPGYDESWRP